MTDRELHALIEADPERGWRAFVDQYSPVLLGLIEQAGVGDRDAVVDVYVRVCERLAADRCARLRRRDPSKGVLAAWLNTLVRHVVVDWVRSRTGRRRLFGAVRRLSELDQRVFTLYYWDQRSPTDIAETLRTSHESLTLADVMDALHRIHAALSDRHRRELVATLARTKAPRSLDDATPIEMPRDERWQSDPESSLRVKELDAVFAEALRRLPAEDAAIVRLLFVQGWTRETVRRALHLDELTPQRVREILANLRTYLTARGVGGDTATPGLAFLED